MAVGAISGNVVLNRFDSYMYIGFSMEIEEIHPVSFTNDYLKTIFLILRKWFAFAARDPPKGKNVQIKPANHLRGETLDGVKQP